VLIIIGQILYLLYCITSCKIIKTSVCRIYWILMLRGTLAISL